MRYFLMMGLCWVARPVWAQADTGAYAGLAAGNFTYEQSARGGSLDDHVQGFGLYGGYRFSKNLGIEAAYGKTADFHWQSTLAIPTSVPVTGALRVDYESFSARAMGFLPLSAMTLYGGLGYYDADVDGSAAVVDSFGPVRTEGYSRSDRGLTAALGAQWDLRVVSVRFGYEWFDTDACCKAADFAVSAHYRF